VGRPRTELLRDFHSMIGRKSAEALRTIKLDLGMQYGPGTFARQDLRNEVLATAAVVREHPHCDITLEVRVWCWNEYDSTHAQVKLCFDVTNLDPSCVKALEERKHAHNNWNVRDVRYMESKIKALRQELQVTLATGNTH